MPFSLPPVVGDFITAHLRTVDDLHLLIVASNDPDRWWDASAVTRELLIEETDARGLLEHLAAHNLLDIRITADVRYRYRPGTPELNRAAQACMEAYRGNPAAIWRALVKKRGRRSIRDFADAFRIRRDDR